MNSQKKTPQIRFCGFDDEWKPIKLETTFEDYIERTTIQNQYPVLTSSQQKGIVLQQEYFADRQVTTNDNVGYFVLPRGYFTYRSRSDNNVFVFNRNDVVDKGIISYFYPVFNVTGADSNFFLRRVNNGLEEELAISAEGTGQHVLSLKKFKEIVAFFPSIDEQKRVGQLFESIDRLISTSQSQLSKLHALKKSMLEKMFPKDGESVPEVRFRGFSEKWELRTISSLFHEYSEKNHSELPVLTITQGKGTINREDAGRNVTYDREATSSYKLVRAGDFIVHLRSFEGGLEKANSNGIVSPAYHILHGENIDTSFYYLYFRSFDFIHNKLKNCVYGIRDGRSIDITEMMKIEIPYTSLDEQVQIGKYFNSLDNLIALKQAELDKLLHIKKGLLTRIFV